MRRKNISGSESLCCCHTRGQSFPIVSAAYLMLGVMLFVGVKLITRKCPGNLRRRCRSGMPHPCRIPAVTGPYKRCRQLRNLNTNPLLGCLAVRTYVETVHLRLCSQIGAAPLLGRRGDSWQCVLASPISSGRRYLSSGRGHASRPLEKSWTRVIQCRTEFLQPNSDKGSSIPIKHALIDYRNRTKAQARDYESCLTPTVLPILSRGTARRSYIARPSFLVHTRLRSPRPLNQSFAKHSFLRHI